MLLKVVYCMYITMNLTHWFPNSEAQKRKPVLSTHIELATGTVSKYFILISVTYCTNKQIVIAQCEHRHSIVSAHRRILGMASVVCVLVKICVSSISLYKLDTDKLTAPFESTHQFTLVCTVSDSKTVPGCHYNLCSNHSFVLTD